MWVMSPLAVLVSIEQSSGIRTARFGAVAQSVLHGLYAWVAELAYARGRDRRHNCKKKIH